MLYKNKSRAFALSFLFPIALCHASDPNLEQVEVIGISEKSGLDLKRTANNADRLGLSLLDTPASIDIISAADIAAKADYSSLGAATRATGMTANSGPANGGLTFATRGFAGHDSIVQTYDGTRMYAGFDSANFPADTWPFAQIEILRGPGSVIHGVGAIGATVNYTAKKPEFIERKTQLDLTAGENSLRRIALGSGGQISSEWAYQLNAVHHETQGTVDMGDEKRQVIAQSIAYQPKDNLRFTLSVDYADVDAPRYFGVPHKNGKFNKKYREKNFNVNDAIVSYQDLWPRLAIDWQINDQVRFKQQWFYLTADRHWRNAEVYTIDEADATVLREYYIEILHEQKQLGNNTDVQFEFAGLGLKHKANLGFNVNRIDFTHINNKPYDDFSSEKNLHESVYWSDAGPTEKDLSTETYQYALYADYLLDVSQQFLVVAGLRSDWVNFEREEKARQFNNGNNREASTLKNDFQTTSWRLGAVYKPLDSMSLYLQYSEASDALGHIISTSRSDLKLSEGTQVELGLKQSLLDDQLQYTVALFNINQTNLVDKAQAGASERQVGEQASKGVEWEVFYMPHESIDITANAAFYEARYKNFTDYSDNRPYNIPEQTANLWMNWRPVDDWQLSGGLRHVGMRYTDESNTTEMPAYQVYDAAIAWQYNDATRFTLRGKNLSDSLDYVLSSYGDQWILGESRQFELSMNYQL